MNISSLLDAARALARQGRFAEALEQYRGLSQRYPERSEVHHGHGSVLLALGHYESALLAYARAVELDQSNPSAWNNRGCALQAVGRHDEALESFARALELTPNDVDVIYNRANSMRAAGRTEDAILSYADVLSLDEQHIGALSNKAALLAAIGMHDESLELMNRACSLQPDNREFRLNRGGVLLKLRLFEDAVVDFSIVARQATNLAATSFGLGCALLGLGRASEALAAFDQMLAIAPHDANALVNRGVALSTLGKHSEAIECYDRAIKAKPRFVQALVNKGASLIEPDEIEKALSCYEEALTLDCDNSSALIGRGELLRGLGRHVEAVESLERALLNDPLNDGAINSRLSVALDTCDWQKTHQLVGVIERNRMPILPLTAVRTPLNAEYLLNIAKAECKRISFGKSIAKRIGSARQSRGKIRLGYISSDFGHHAVGYQIGELIEKHDRSRFEVNGFSAAVSDGSALQRRIYGAFDRLDEVKALEDSELSKLISSRGIDVLVDLNGHTKGNRLGALVNRPAPIQVTYLGFPGTLGCEFIDYVICDRVVLPESDRRWFVEQPVWMPDCYQVSDSQQGWAAPSTRLAEGLPEHAFVFASFNAAHKITAEVWATWMRLLIKVVPSVLWVVASHEVAKRTLLNAAAQHGVGEDRIVFCATVSPERHLARQNLADLFLDTLPYCAHGTASLSLRMGLPILTCEGGTFAGRVGVSLLSCLGMHELIASSLADYEARALELALTPGLIASVKSRLAASVQQSPLFDAKAFARNLESAFEEMVDRYDRGQAASEPIIVAKR